MEKWKDKEVVVLGMGRSGQAAAEWLLGQGAKVTMFDETLSTTLQRTARRWEERGATVLLGSDRMKRTNFAYGIISPGIDPRKGVIRDLVEA